MSQRSLCQRSSLADVPPLSTAFGDGLLAMDNPNFKCKENCENLRDDVEPSRKTIANFSYASSQRMAAKMSVKVQRPATPHHVDNSIASGDRKTDSGNNMIKKINVKPHITNPLKKKVIVAVVLTAALKPNLSPKGPTKNINKTKSSTPKVEPNDNVHHPLNTSSTATTMTVCPGIADNVCQCPILAKLAGPPERLLAHGVDAAIVTSWLTSKRITELRAKALDAAKHHKTFTIRGCFYSIRRGLQQRGWVERLDVHRRQTSGTTQGSSQLIYNDEMPERKLGESKRVHILKCERNIMSRFLEHKPIDFLWAARKERTDWEDMTLNPAMQISRFHKKPFTSKSGMCAVMRDFHWYFEEGTAEMYYPRCYNVFNAEDLDEFVENFRMSACVSILRILCDCQRMTASGAPNADTVSEVPLATLAFAIEQCRKFVRFRQHDDIDDAAAEWMQRENHAEQHEWELLLLHHQQLTTNVARLATDAKLQSIMPLAQRTLGDVAVRWPQYGLDGCHNIWIVKPSNRCRGRGIRLMNDLKAIKEVVNSAGTGRWVVQKYIERPLIIHNCKFDIRQWFLVTSVQPLVVWMYRHCYLRFSTQEFSLHDFHESVHLTNHAVQKRYRANGQRDQRLPKDNMWDSDTFQQYLSQIGAENAWHERIYPGMKRALIGTMLASQDLMDRRVNTFELFGADFMLTEDFQPWLLEINSSPDLAASTSVTSRMCPQCLDDLVKVVVDYRANPKATTGQFELIYKQSIPSAPAYLGLDLYLTGTQMIPKVFRNQANRQSLRKRTPPINNAVPPSELVKRPFQNDVLDSVVLRSLATTASRVNKPMVVSASRRYRTPVVSLTSTVGHAHATVPRTTSTRSTAAEFKTVLHQQNLIRNGSRGLSMRVKQLFRAIDQNENIQCVGKSYDRSKTPPVVSNRINKFRPSRSMSNLVEDDKSKSKVRHQLC